MPDYSKKIEFVWAQEKEAEERKMQEEQLRNETRVKEHERLLQLEQKAQGDALSLIASILEDLKDNLKEVAQHPLHDIVTKYNKVVLHWGNKLSLSSEDQTLIYNYRNKNFVSKLFTVYPDFITENDSQVIEVVLCGNRLPSPKHLPAETVETLDQIYVNNLGPIKRDDFVNNPDLLLPLLSSALKNPKKSHYEVFKEDGYSKRRCKHVLKGCICALCESNLHIWNFGRCRRCGETCNHIGASHGGPCNHCGYQMPSSSE